MEAAHAKHVPVISYDRLANAPVDLYVGFDLFSVGLEQAQSLVDHAPKGNYLLLGGSPLDANSKVVRAGQMKVLQPLIDRGDIRCHCRSLDAGVERHRSLHSWSRRN